MGIQLNPLIALLVAFGILLLAFYVFGHVRSDYRTRGRLSPWVAILQTGFFFIYAFSSYLFLDSRFGAVAVSGALLSLSIILMSAGFVVVLLSMPFLGRRSFGRQVGRLHTSGLYRFSRNPQLVGSFVFIVGYVLLWPSWGGLIWAAMWLPICCRMVKGEEEHLVSVFGEEYKAYCQRTPRYIGFSRQQPSAAVLPKHHPPA